MGCCEIPKGMEKPSVRRIEGPKSPFLECHQGRGFTDMQRPKADLGTVSDASCITHGANSPSGSVPVSEPWDIQYTWARRSMHSGTGPTAVWAGTVQNTQAKTDTNQVRLLMKPSSGALPGRSQQRGAAASRRRYDPVPFQKGKKKMRS
jgi:hypothetical protein